MTPFAQLGQMEKEAYVAPPSGYQYAKGSHGINNPYALQATPGTAAAGAGGEGWGWGDSAELGADVVLGSNPFTGVPWYGGKAIKDFSNGDILGGLANIGWGALSFLPGVGSAAKGAVKGGGAVAKMMKPMHALGRGARGLAGRSKAFRYGAPALAGGAAMASYNPHTGQPAGGQYYSPYAAPAYGSTADQMAQIMVGQAAPPGMYRGSPSYSVGRS